jgi:hypothetical protein
MDGKNYKIFDPKRANIVKQEMFQLGKELVKDSISPAEAEARVMAYFNE